MFFYVTIAGLLTTLLQGSWWWALLLYTLTGVAWIFEVSRQRHLNQPMGLMSPGGTARVLVLWPLSVFHWYFVRWQFRGSRFRVCPHEDSQIESRTTVLGEFASLEEVVSFAKDLAMRRQLQIDILDNEALRGKPWIYYVLPMGKVYRLDEPSGMSEYNQGKWLRI